MKTNRRVPLILICLLAVAVSFLLPTLNAQNFWMQMGNDIDGRFSSDEAGSSVALNYDGRIVAVGSGAHNDSLLHSGEARVFQWQDTAWIQMGQNIVGHDSAEYSGVSVALSYDGATLAVGGPGDFSYTGCARIYSWNGSSWIQKGLTLYGENAGDAFGTSVSINADGNTIAVGACFNNGGGIQSGHTRVYRWNGVAWLQLGSDIDGLAAGDESGYSVSLDSSGNRVAIGELMADGAFANTGATRVMDWNGATWNQTGQRLFGTMNGDRLGYAVDLSSNGGILAASSSFHTCSSGNEGMVSVYSLSTNIWTQVGITVCGEALNDRFGTSVSITADGKNFAGGAILNDGSYNDAGSLRVYEWQSGGWTMRGQDMDGEWAGDFFGWSAAISGDGHTVAGGARYNDDNGNNSGHVRVYSCNRYSSVNAFQCTDYVTPSGDTLLVSGNYADTISSIEGCDSIIHISLIIGDRLTISHDTACGYFDSPSGAHYTFSGTYADTLFTVTGCDSIITRHVIIHALPPLTFTLGIDTLCEQNGALTLNASPSGGIFSGPGVSGNYFSPTTLNGWQTLQYVLADSNSCLVATSDSVYVDYCLPVNSTDHEPASVWFNGEENVLVLEANEDVTVQLYNIVGQLLMSLELSAGEHRIPIETDFGQAVCVTINGSHTLVQMVLYHPQ